ncbi:hypothetical protein BCR44DRAFT_1500514 [Catenaria anguillulae PL171]|uniref:Uncharacterized protein n=1 Tax=Catenaria anguillulae PL171 TaxID=765915 RepID=A0A1Y2HIB1_9FUNG|nr:hypothetical protein BCR44DRAFT_1500514 [Catenaria anguillulae PL171]
MSSQKQPSGIEFPEDLLADIAAALAHFSGDDGHKCSQSTRASHMRALWVGTRLSHEKIQSLVRTFLAPSSQLSPTPRLVDLELDNTLVARIDDAFGQWHSMPHISYLPPAPNTSHASFTLPRVGLDKAPGDNCQAMDEDFVPSSKCGTSVHFDLVPILFTKRVKRINERNEPRFVNPEGGAVTSGQVSGVCAEVVLGGWRRRGW